MFQDATAGNRTLCSRTWIPGYHYYACFQPLESLEQIEEAGRYATAPYPDVTYWEQNWRKGGLSERRIAIIKEYNFYNQQYCGCEFSMRKEEKEE